MHLVGNGVVEEAVTHVPDDEVDWGKASGLLPIRLPEGAVEWAAGVIGCLTLTQYFAELHLLEVHCQQAFTLRAEVDRRATVRIDHAALITPAAGDLIGVPPEVPELAAISPQHPYGRTTADRIPTLTRRGI